MKNIFKFILVFFLIIFSLAFNIYINLHPFNHTNVLKNIENFTSDKYGGRLAGSKENLNAAEDIKNQFKAEGLSAFNGDYMDSFQTLCPIKVSGSPYLKILDSNGKIVKNYTYNLDFKEDTLNFKNNNVVFNYKDEIAVKDTLLQVKKNNDYFLFYVPENNKLNFRSSFMSTSVHSMYIMLTNGTYKAIKNYISNGYTISCFIPYISKASELYNVEAVIKGSQSKKPPIIISAHFDHMGTDFSGNIYRGALDNASGISFIIELSKYIKSLGTPDRDIIFIGFNGEELGCQGSSSFVSKYKYYLQGSMVFNFDMIGSNSNVPLSIMGGKKDNTKTSFFRDVTEECTETGIKYNAMFEDSSDHEAFRSSGIDAITFCDDDVQRIHTPDDTDKFINSDSIDRCFKVISGEILKYGFHENFILIYCKQITLYSVPIIFLLSSIYINVFKEKDI